MHAGVLDLSRVSGASVPARLLQTGTCCAGGGSALGAQITGDSSGVGVCGVDGQADGIHRVTGSIGAEICRAIGHLRVPLDLGPNIVVPLNEVVTADGHPCEYYLSAEA